MAHVLALLAMIVSVLSVQAPCAHALAPHAGTAVAAPVIADAGHEPGGAEHAAPCHGGAAHAEAAPVETSVETSVETGATGHGSHDSCPPDCVGGSGCEGCASLSAALNFTSSIEAPVLTDRERDLVMRGLLDAVLASEPPPPRA